MARPKKDVTLTGAVYCDWNAFSFVAPLPDKKYWATGDLVIWSWSGDSRQPQSKSNDGLFAVSVIIGTRRHRLKVKRTRVHRKLAFGTDTGREERLTELVNEMRALQGRKIIKARQGYEVTLQELASPENQPAPVTAPAVGWTPPPPVKAPRVGESMVAAGESPLSSRPNPAQPFSRPRGRIKPGIRSDSPEPVPAAAPPEPVTVVVAPVVAVIVSIQLAVAKKRRRKKAVDLNQGNLF